VIGVDGVLTFRGEVFDADLSSTLTAWMEPAVRSESMWSALGPVGMWGARVGASIGLVLLLLALCKRARSSYLISSFSNAVSFVCVSLVRRLASGAGSLRHLPGDPGP
jgi:hypothetical protein